MFIKEYKFFKTPSSFFLSLLLAFLFSLTSLALDENPSLVPIGHDRIHSSDLVYQGKLITPEEAEVLRREQGVDLSTLDPISTTDLWRNISPQTLDNESEIKKLGVQSGDHLQYQSILPSRSGNFRFHVQTLSGPNNQKNLTIILNKDAHAILMRKALLQKLGYETPAIQWLSKVEIHFEDYIEKELFITELAQGSLGAPSRWIKDEDSLTNKEIKTLILEDIIVTEAQPKIFNLPLGIVPAPYIDGRRILRSLLVPFSLVQTDESINIASWKIGRIEDNSIYFPYPTASDFYTSYEDAQWIARRIEKLTRQDFEEIVQQSHYPKAVELLLVEKLISRRNHLLTLLKIKHQELSFNPKVSYQEDLIHGKLQKENWEGYASRFSYPDVPSPLSNSEIFAYGKSILFSNAMSNLVSYVNSELPRTDINKEANKHFEKLFQKQVKKFLETGKNSSVPLGVWAFPTFGADIIAAREVITGNYLGTENIIQLADTIGFSAKAGVFFGIDGITGPGQVTGSADLRFTRTYTHLRPLKSIKAALKQPLKNIVVPFYQSELARALKDFETLPEDEKEKKEAMQKLLNTFKEKLPVGDSLIVSDYVNLGGVAQYGRSVYSDLKLLAGLRADGKLLFRLHIHRKNNDTIQIFDDFGNEAELRFFVQLKAFLPLIQLDIGRQDGNVKVKFYEIKIPNNQDQFDSKFLTKIIALKQAIMNSDLELVKTISKPFVIKNDFQDNDSNFRFLMFRNKKLDAKNIMEVEQPSGDSKMLYRLRFGSRNGIDNQSVVSDGLDALINELTNEESLGFRTTPSSDPGYSIWGKSYKRLVTFESEINNEESETENRFITVQRVWKGWEISPEKVLKIVHEINDQYHFNFHDDIDFNTTKRLLLYEIALNIRFYEPAIEKLANTSPDEFKKVLQKYVNWRICRPGQSPYIISHWRSNRHTGRSGACLKVHAFWNNMENYHKNVEKNNWEDASKNISLMVSNLERLLDADDLVKLVGGTQNVYIYSTITGFREGDEAADQMLISSSMGEFGGEYERGPVQRIREFLGISESEFFGYWMRGVF